MDKKELMDLTIELPRSIFTDESLGRLRQLVENKSDLLKKAFDTDKLEIEVSDDKLSFPWFKYDGSAMEARAYSDFISALADLSLKQKRINRISGEIENEKYTFRCFLLRLGLIGSDHKESRKVLLKNLQGSSAFRDV